MNHESAFLEAILEDPGNDAPRLIFADWLEENGQARRSEFIRIQCETEKMLGLANRGNKKALANFQILADSQYEFTQGNLSDLIPSVVLTFSSNMKCRRGFLSELSCTMQDWLDHGKEIVLATPLEKVTITDKTPIAGPRQCYWPHQEFPRMLFNIIMGGRGGRDRDGKWFYSPDDARSALSSACILWAKQENTPRPAQAAQSRSLPARTR